MPCHYLKPTPMRRLGEREARNPTWKMSYELLGFATLYPTYETSPVLPFDARKVVPWEAE